MNAVIPMHRGGTVVKEAEAPPAGWTSAWWLIEDDGTLVVGGWRDGEFVTVAGPEGLAAIREAGGLRDDPRSN